MLTLIKVCNFGKLANDGLDTVMREEESQNISSPRAQPHGHRQGRMPGSPTIFASSDKGKIRAAATPTLPPGPQRVGSRTWASPPFLLPVCFSGKLRGKRQVHAQKDTYSYLGALIKMKTKFIHIFTIQIILVHSFFPFFFQVFPQKSVTAKSASDMFGILQYP